MPADMKSGASDPRSSGERDKALNLVLGQIERNFGKGSIMRLGDASRMRVETISTGALTLDLALGGGYPKGRVVEIYGPESSGKTTLTLHAIAEVQKRGGVAAFVDAEHALDPVYAASLGVDVLPGQPTGAWPAPRRRPPPNARLAWPSLLLCGGSSTSHAIHTMSVAPLSWSALAIILCS